MSRHRPPQHGEGTAWLVLDMAKEDYSCSWYTGTNDGRLVEHARIPTASDAVAWGRSRTPRVRIRTADARTYWAGTAPRPEGFSHTWTDSDTTNAANPATTPNCASSPGRRTGRSTHPQRQETHRAEHGVECADDAETRCSCTIPAAPTWR